MAKVQHDIWRDWGHPKRVAWRDRMAAPAVGSKRRRMNPGCYGVCCGEGVSGGQLCTVCRKYGAPEKCCGHYTVFVNPRIRVPRVSAHNRWKEFTRRFPRYAFDEGLRVVRCEVCGKDYALKHTDRHVQETCAGSGEPNDS